MVLVCSVDDKFVWMFGVVDDVCDIVVVYCVGGIV